MSPEQVAALALEFAEVTEERPFGPDNDVYKVAGKVFALLSAQEDPPRVSLKCEPSLAVHLREQYEAITPGYHLNKRHWNTVLLDGSVPAYEIAEMVEHSYLRVVAGLPKATRLRLTAS
ncbi:MAG TPA: MmcQ/YjbR family DNA-binding protein [Pseudonocardiaceae bacterium]|jgi:predicted DNA-binding protein (MmcQ/YjbR family)|nr:MmcQ/YjbR family DNA-binding protein [Pseudonocardiaceae bacterium]